MKTYQVVINYKQNGTFSDDDIESVIYSEYGPYVNILSIEEI